MNQENSIQIPESPLSHFIFSDTRMAWFWLIVRLYVGWEWLVAGWAKIHNPVWVGSDAGVAVQGFLTNALTKTTGAHPDVSMWYASFIENFSLHHTVGFSYAVAYGELLVGAALIVGIFTGVSAFFGAFMNLNYLLAGTVSANPVFLTLGILLMLSWRIAGRYGLDYWALPAFGTPWYRGTVFRK